MNQTINLYEFDIVEKVFSPACQINLFTRKVYNLYGIEIPFQLGMQES
ncbi:MAG: hypothetical protein PHI40_05595 [Caldisericia bacterium]|nr:hypothetical protein [Caldisericia bacterium]MDD4614861.1 hypothetical protein [Caldisericia bacterium]